MSRLHVPSLVALCVAHLVGEGQLDQVRALRVPRHSLVLTSHTNIVAHAEPVTRALHPMDGQCENSADTFLPALLTTRPSSTGAESHKPPGDFIVCERGDEADESALVKNATSLRRQISPDRVGVVRESGPLCTAAPALGWPHLDANARSSLQTAPMRLDQFTALRSLDLTRCRLNAVPPALQRLTNLVHLNLSRNRLVRLPDWFGPCLSRLRILMLCRAFPNGVSRLPDSFAHLVELRHLSLCCNGYYDDAAQRWRHETLWPPIYGLVQLRRLTLLESCVRHMDSRIKYLRHLTRIEGIRSLRGVPPELGQLRGLYEIRGTGIKAPCLPHEVALLTQRASPTNRVAWSPKGQPNETVVRCVPDLVDMCLSALVPCPRANAATRDHRARLFDTRRLQYRKDDDASGKQEGEGKYYYGGATWTCKNGGPVNATGGGPRAQVPFVWDDPPPASGDGGADGMHATDHQNVPCCPLDARTAYMLPIELVERAARRWSRTCALCERPIVGPPVLARIFSVDSRWVAIVVGNRSDLLVDCAYCVHCAPSVPRPHPDGTNVPDGSENETDDMDVSGDSDDETYTDSTDDDNV